MRIINWWLGRLLYFLFLVMFLSSFCLAAIPNKLQNVSLDPEKCTVSISTLFPAEYKITELTSPDRIVIDLKDVEYPNVRKTIRGVCWIKNIRVNQFEKDKVRIVIDVNKRIKYNVFLSSDRKNIIVESQDLKEDLKKEKVGLSAITYLGVREVRDGVQIILSGTGPLRYRYKEISHPPQIILEILSSYFLLPYNALMVEKGVVDKITILPSENNVQLKIDLTSPASTDVSLLNNNKQIVLKVIEKDEKSKSKNYESAEEVILEKREENKPSEEKNMSEENNSDEAQEETAQQEIPIVFVYPEISKIVAKTEDRKVKIQIVGNEEISFKVEEIDSPPQIIITIPGFSLNLETNIINVGIGTVKNIEANQVSLEPPVSKILINLVQKTPYYLNLSPDKKEAIVDIETPETISKEVEKTLSQERSEKLSSIEKIPPTISSPVRLVSTSFLPVNILDVNFQKLKDVIVININGDGTLRYKFLEAEKPDKFIIEIYNAVLKSKKKKLKVNYGGVKTIEISQISRNGVPLVKSEILLEKKLEREISLSPSLKEIILSIKRQEEIPLVEKKPAISEIPEIPPLPPIPSTSSPQPMGLITMDFKDADVRDVIKIFSEMTGANLVVDDSVSGKITISLRNVPFEQALEMILAPNDLMLYEMDNTYVVVPRKDTKLIGRIGGATIGGFLVESFSIKGYTPDQFYEILKEIMPEFEGKRIVTGRPDTITLIGTKKSLDRVRNFISTLEPIPHGEIKTFDLKGQKYEEVKKIIEQMVPEVKDGIIDTENKSSITIAGSKENLSRVEKIISNLQLPPSYQIFELTATDPEKFKAILSQLYPQVEIIYVDAGSKSTSVTLKGSKSDLGEVEKLVQELNQKKSQPKEIEIIKLEHFETVPDLREQKDVDIAKLLMAMVPDVKITQDERTNSIIVEGTSLDIRRVKELLPKIDVKVPIIRLYVQVIDSKSPISKYLTPGFLGKSSLGSFNTSTGDFQLNLVRDEAVKVLRATLANLETKEEIRYLTNTELHTFSGRQVKLDMRDKHTILVPGGPILDVQGRIVGTTPPSYKTLDGAGLTIEITPRLKSEIAGDKPEESIVLLINITVYSPTTEKPIKEATIGLNERKIQDVLVRTKSGESIVISGLLTQYERESISRVPFFSKIPFVKNLFTQKSSETTGSEVTIMITPEVNPTK